MAIKRNRASASGRMVGEKRVSRPLARQPASQPATQFPPVSHNFEAQSSHTDEATLDTEARITPLVNKKKRLFNELRTEKDASGCSRMVTTKRVLGSLAPKPSLQPATSAPQVTSQPVTQPQALSQNSAEQSFNRGAIGSFRMAGVKRASQPFEPQPTLQASTSAPQTTSQLPQQSHNSEAQISHIGANGSLLMAGIKRFPPQPSSHASTSSAQIVFHPARQLPQQSQNFEASSSNIGVEESDPEISEKRVRGPAKAISDWGELGFQLAVGFNSTFHPVGPNGKKLISQLGVLVRNSELVPLTYADWSEMPKDVLERLWNDVKNNVVDCPERFKSVCFAKCGKMWRSYKSRIKNEYFLPCRNNPNIYELRPERIPLSQWKLLVDYWSDADVQKIVVQNATNRSRCGPPCCIGRTHLQELAYQLAAKEQPADRMSLYIASHNKDHPEVSAHIIEYNRLLDEIPEEERGVEERNRIFLEIFGPDEHGYCRSVGSGIHPNVVYPDISSQAAIDSAINHITKEYHLIFQKEQQEFRQKLQEEHIAFRLELEKEYHEFQKMLDHEHSEHF